MSSTGAAMAPLMGPERSIHGKARLPDPRYPAKLEVSFFWPVWADYWILEVGPNYEYAVVGHPSRDYLWILSRVPQLDPHIYDRILASLRGRHHYDITASATNVATGTGAWLNVRSSILTWMLSLRPLRSTTVRNCAANRCSSAECTAAL